MTRYETAVATLSMWLTETRTPSDAPPLTSHRSSRRFDVAPQKAALFATLFEGA